MARRHSQNSIHDMFLSLYKGNRKLLHQYKTRNGDLDLYGPDGNTLLIKSILEQNQDKIDDLLFLECNVNKCDKHGNSPLLWSVRTNLIKLVQTLLDRGADVNRKGAAGKVALTEAVVSQNLEMVNLLLGNGADCNMSDQNMKTPLLYSTENTEITDAIMESGHVDLDKQLLISLSAGYYNIDSRIFDMLLRNGANPFTPFTKEGIFNGMIQGELAETSIYKGTFQVKTGTMLAPFIREYGYITSLSSKNEFLDHLITCKSFIKFYRIDVDNDVSIFKRYIGNVLNVIIKLISLGLVLPSHEKIWRCKETCSCSRFIKRVNVDSLFARKITKYVNQPMVASLLLQCRTTIRSSIGISCSIKINNLSLPNKMKKFLTFEGEL